MSVTSPGKTYSVELSGHLRAPAFPVDEHYVRLTARRGDVVFVRNHEIHFADWFDESFADDYGPASWPAENVLRFGPPLTGKGQSTIVRVRNETTRPVSFLKVVCEMQILLLFDLAPGGETTAPASADWDSSLNPWVHADGIWATGNPIRGVGENVDMSPNAKSCEYEIAISDAGLSIRPNCRD